MTETIARGDGSLTRIGRHLPAVLLLVGYYALAVSGVWDKSVTCDEIAHLTAGYSYWITHDYRLNPENGNLPQRWAALPLLLGRPAFPALEQPPWYHSDVWWVGHQFFYESGNDPDAMLFQGRVMMALLGVGLGVAVYVWSMRLF
ncbi:MAG TPA: hypothetical protein VNK04_23385, partial [Gemmataceae bacterium]|nr:hypothetical protein [Gemmataceae bacterium]